MFSFWWRDTRLAELAHTNPPSPPPPLENPNHCEVEGEYQFPYPTTLAPVPYHTDTTLPVLLTHVVPLSRAPRAVTITLPLPSPAGASRPTFSFGMGAGGEGMEVDVSKGRVDDGVIKFGRGYVQTEAQVAPDGLLLYVKEASYEAGMSPLSSWIPIVGYGEGQEEGKGEVVGPLDLFQTLVHRRLLRVQGDRSGNGEGAMVQEVDMEIEM